MSLPRVRRVLLRSPKPKPKPNAGHSDNGDDDHGGGNGGPVLVVRPASSVFEEPSLEFRYSSQQQQQQRPLLVAQTETMELKGVVDDSFPSCKYAVGVFRKEDGSLTLCNAPVFSVSVSVAAHKTTPKPTVAKEDDSKATQLKSDRQEGMAARKLLGQAFGTSRVQSAIRSIEQSRINIQNLASVSQVIHSSVESKVKEMATQEDIELEADLDKAVPPFDKEAETADAIYPFDQLITPAEFAVVPAKRYLKLDARRVQEMRESSEFSPYVLRHFDTIASNAETTKPSVFRIKTLLYLSYLLRFYDLNPSHANTTDKLAAALSDVPAEVQERFLRLFLHERPSQREGAAASAAPLYDMSRKERDRLISFILVTALYLEGFSMDPSSLLSDLHLPLPKVVDHFRYVGCSYTKKRKRKNDDGSEQVVESAVVRLEAPLKFPKIKRGGGASNY